MKRAVVSVLAATALVLGACSHLTETAARQTVPVASLTVDEIRAELAAVSKKLDDTAAVAEDDLKQLSVQARAAAFNAGAVHRVYVPGLYQGAVEGPREWGISHNSPRRLTKVERLRKRQAELRAQLAVVDQPQS